MTNLNTTERRSNDILTSDLEGSIRLGGHCTKLRQLLRSLISEGERKIILNLANVTYMDSSGLRELVAGFTALQKSGGTLKLLHLTERID